MATVKGRMIQKLTHETQLDMDDLEEVLPVVITRINTDGWGRGLVHRDNSNKETLLPDCWDTDENLYVPELVEALWKIVYRYSYDWCAIKMQSMK